ncbi:MAG: ATP-dependent helicase [Candidatus Lambdaproteobacteria bacterium]|nr:ATP-dependent helicase [Candidatus Lambdaproteobacteria bacterium]
MASPNAQQEVIIEHLDGPALVIAGAGTGKTRVITHRVARLIEQGVPPSAILMVTFTNKAAEEMRSRVEGLLRAPAQGRAIVAGTFHSVANRFLRRYATRVGFQNNFTILDESDARDLIKAAMGEVVGKEMGKGIGRKFPAAGVVQSVLSMAFNRDLPLATLLRLDYPWLMEFEPELERIRALYKRKKAGNNAMDFDDLLANWLLLLQQNPEIELARQLRYLLVDEYQDTNIVQAQILELLAREHRNLMVVGDDAQSIYGWRGANFENIFGFPKRFGGAVYRLEENYRSTPPILELANESIARNQSQFAKHLVTIKTGSERPEVIHVMDQNEEAELVIRRILELCDRDLALRDMAVLYRSHVQAAVLQLRLTERGIPFVIRSGIKFFEQAHIKDSLAFLRIVFNPLDEIAWMRLLKLLPGIGNATAQRIFKVFLEQRAVRLSRENLALEKALPAKAREGWGRLTATFREILPEGMAPAEMIARVVAGFYKDVLYTQFDNPREREADLGFMAEFAGRYRSLERFLNQLALVGSTVIRDHEESANGEQDQLTLTTVHQAKGLEWEAVFLIGLADGEFPHARCLEPPERLEEERRLFYVAVTRCKRHLTLTVPLVSSGFGQRQICRPSRFVEELRAEVAEVTKLAGVDELRPYQGFRSTLSVEL